MKKIRKSFEEKKTKKLFSCGKITVNPLRKKKNRTGKTQIALSGHAPDITAHEKTHVLRGPLVKKNLKNLEYKQL